MNKIFNIAALATLALAGCTKVAPEIVVKVEEEHAITFAAVNSIASTKGEYDKANSFGTYAWSKSITKGDYFMENVKVAFDAVNGKWFPVSTYYWPKEATVDFVSYSPYSETPWVNITESKLSASASGTLEDYLYANKAVDCTFDNSKEGVATIFHHAVSRVSFNIKALFTSYGTAPDVTTWKITLSNATLKNVYDAGSVELNISEDRQTWTLPSPAIWTVSGEASDRVLVASPTEITTDGINAAQFLVVPQAVSSMQLVLDYTIVTTLANGNELTESISRTVNMSDFRHNSASIDNWNMNDNITYHINIKPTADSGTAGSGGTPDDVVIKFDPSVDGWNNIDVSASIQI